MITIIIGLLAKEVVVGTLDALYSGMGDNAENEAATETGYHPVDGLTTAIHFDIAPDTAEFALSYWLKKARCVNGAAVAVRATVTAAVVQVRAVLFMNG